MEEDQTQNNISIVISEEIEKSSGGSANANPKAEGSVGPTTTEMTARKKLTSSPSFYEQARRNSRILVEDTLALMIARRTKSNEDESNNSSRNANITFFGSDDPVRKALEESQKPLWIYSNEIGSSQQKKKDDGTDIKSSESNIIQQMTKKNNKPAEQGYPLFERRRSSSSASMGRESFNRIRASLTARRSIHDQHIVEEDSSGNENSAVKRLLAEEVVTRRESNFAEFERKFQSTLGIGDIKTSKPKQTIPITKKQIIEEEEFEYSNVDMIMNDISQPRKVEKIAKKSVIVLDPHIIEKPQPYAPPINHTNFLELKAKPRMAFSKASTGRLGQTKASIPPILPKNPLDQEVMLVGQRVGNEIIKVKTDARIHHHISEPIKTLEPIYFKEEKRKKPVVAEKNESRIDIVKVAEKKEEPQIDTGVFRKIVDVDAMIPHFAAILEAKRRNLKAGVIDESKIMALSEAPQLPPPAPEATLKTSYSESSQNYVPFADSPSVQAAEVEPSVLAESQKMINNEVEKVSRHNSATPTEPSIVYNYSPHHTERTDNELTESNQSNQTHRPPTSARIRFKNDAITDSKRSIHSGKSSSSYISKSSSRPIIKSASTRATSASGTGSTPSSSCTCSDSSCSYCYSRSVSEVIPAPSMSDLGGTASEFALNVESDHYDRVFTKFKGVDDDPWGNISILDMKIKNKVDAKDDEIVNREILQNLVPFLSLTTEEEDSRGKKSILVKGRNVIPVTPKSIKKPSLNENEEKIKNEKMQATIDELIEKMPLILIERLVEDKTKGNPIHPVQLEMISENIEQSLPIEIIEPAIEAHLASLDQLKSLEVQPERLNEHQVELIKKYQMEKISNENKKASILKKKNSTNRNPKGAIFVPLPKKPSSGSKKGDASDDGFETEDEQPVKIVRNRGRELWKVIKKHLQKKFLIRSFTIKPEEGSKDKEAAIKTEASIIPKPAAIVESTEEIKKTSIDLTETSIYQYHVSRRILDMERFPLLYKGKRIDPETKELDIQCTIRPIIGIAETERAKLPGADLDQEKAYLLSIRNGVILNGYVQGSNKNLYETVHGIQRRKAGLLPADRAKYPTYDDPGSPVDSSGAPIIQKEGSTAQLPEIDLNEELEKVELLLSDPQGVIASNLRRRGILLARLEKYARAMEDIDRAVHMEPANIEGLWHRHQQYLRINDAESALADLDSITDQNKAHFPAFQAKARIYQALGMYKLAVSNYSMVIRFKSENTDAYHNRACLYEMEDEIILANEDYRSVRLLDPTNDQAIHNLAMYSFQRQLWSDCISEFTKLINVDPENAQAYMYRGRSYAALSFYSEAMQDLTQAIRLSPDTAVFYFHRGCLLREQHVGKAIQDFSISILLDSSPDNCDAYFYRAQLYQKQKHNELSILDYLTVIDLNPKKSRAFLNLGILYMKHTKNYIEALAYLNKGIATDQTNLRGYISRGELYEILYRQALLQQANVNTKRKLRITTKLDTATNYAMMAIKDYSRAIHLRPCNYLLFLYRGRMLLKQGKVEEATIDFHAAFDLNSSIAQTFMQRALILSFQRKYKQIIEEYDEKKANQQLVRDPALLLLVAKARIRYGDFEGALADLNSVSDHARVDHQISLQKGICYEHLKNWSMASAEFSNCINQMPNFSKAYYHRGLCKLAEGESSGEYDLNKAIDLDPKFFDAYVTRAAYYESIENFAKGIVDCDEALRLEPTSIRAHILRGSCKCKLNQYSLAISDFTKAIFIDKTSPFAFYNRAIAYQYAGEHYNAIKDYSIVILLHDNMNAYKNRAMLYWKLGDNENALLDFLAAKNLNPNDPKLRSLLGLGLQKVGKYENSCVEFTVAMNLDGNMKEAILGRGNVYAAMGDLKRSRKDYSRVLHMYPRSSDTLINIAYTMQSEGRPKDAWRYFTMAYTIDPRCTAALKGRALVNSSTNNPFSAYLDITRAIEISPENAELLNNRGVIYESLEDNVSALQNYKLAINADSTFGLAYYNAANHYLKQHSWEKAADYYNKAIEFDFKDHTALLNRGIALLMIKKYDDAKADFDLVLQLSPDSSHAYFNLGYLYSLLSKYELAEESYTKVIELTPSDKIAYLCRAEARSKQGKWKLALEDHSVLL